MILGRVVGQVWGTRKHPRLERQKMLIVRPLCWYGPDHPTDHLVAVDPVGAQVGQDVVVCLGLPARLALGDPRHPVEASVAAIVDRVSLSRSAAARPFFRFAGDRRPEGLEETP
ncbi:EutN/CcmL family microcompartment protein [Myxococcota bacterium]|jgi:microcompartment protein CcmK/EutM|nr:EutN/CcmL family microcompartment protein [Myxococcota bacterium]